MADVIGEAFVAIRAMVDQFGPELTSATTKAADEAGTAAGETLKEKVEGSFADIGPAVGRALKPAALAIAGFTALAGREFQAGAFTIRRETGLTGEALDGLVNSMRNVGRSGITTNLETVGVVIAELNRRLNLTGPAAEALAKQVVLLAEITGGDAAASVELIATLMQRFQVETEQQIGTLDLFHKAAQASGESVENLISGVLKTKAPLEALGFSLEDAVAFIAQIEAKGGDATKVVTALTLGFNRLVGSVKDPVAEFDRLVERIGSAETAVDAGRIAIEAFGARAGPILAAQIRSGAFEVDAFSDQLERSTDTIQKTRDETTSWLDRLAQIKTAVVATIGPIANQTAAFFTIAAGMEPMIRGGQALLGVLPKIGPAIAAIGSAAAASAPQLIVLAAAITAGIKLYEAFSFAAEEQAKSVEASARLTEAIVARMAAGYETEESALRRINSVIHDSNLSRTEQIQVAVRAAAALQEYKDAVAAGKDPTAALTKEVDSLAEAHGRQAARARAARLAELELAGGFLGLVASLRSARDAQNEYEAAGRRVDRLTAEGRQGTERYAAAQRELDDATLEVVTRFESFRSQLREYRRELEETGHGQDQINERLEATRRVADVTRGDFQKLIGTLDDYVDDINRTPRAHATKFETPGLEKAITDVQRFIDKLKNVPRQTIASAILNLETGTTPEPSSRGGGGRRRRGGGGAPPEQATGTGVEFDEFATTTGFTLPGFREERGASERDRDVFVETEGGIPYEVFKAVEREFNARIRPVIRRALQEEVARRPTRQLETTRGGLKDRLGERKPDEMPLLLWFVLHFAIDFLTAVIQRRRRFREETKPFLDIIRGAFPKRPESEAEGTALARTATSNGGGRAGTRAVPAEVIPATRAGASDRPSVTVHIHGPVITKDSRTLADLIVEVIRKEISRAGR